MYVSQSDKGGLVYGGNLDYYNSYAQRGNLPVVHEVATELLAVLPECRKGAAGAELGRPRRHDDGRQPDHHRPARCRACTSNCGWNYGGFKATPGSGWCFAWTIANDEPHALNAPFTLERFHEGRPIDEWGAGPTPRLH